MGKKQVLRTIDSYSEELYNHLMMFYNKSGLEALDQMQTSRSQPKVSARSQTLESDPLIQSDSDEGESKGILIQFNHFMKFVTPAIRYVERFKLSGETKCSIVCAALDLLRIKHSPSDQEELVQFFLTNQLIDLIDDIIKTIKSKEFFRRRIFKCLAKLR